MNKKVPIDKIKALLSSSNLEDIKIGVLYLAEYGVEVIKKVLKNGYAHNCLDVPEYMPEHPLEPEFKSIIIYDSEIELGAISPYYTDKEQWIAPDEFF